MNTQELIERLRAEHNSLCDGDWHLLRASTYDLAAQALTASQERERVLREALAPFAAAADDLDEDHRDGLDIWESPAAMSIYAGCLRNARQALQSTEQQ